MKFLLYCQSLSVSGHFVRTYEIARALSASHRVHVVDGGLPIPRRAAPVTLLPLPRIHRRAGRLVPVEAGCRIADVMRARRGVLEKAVREIDPDAIVVEHFPFSKGSLRDEVVAMLACSRARAVCSLRDIAPLTRTDPVEPQETLQLLDRYFDAVLVHGDPSLTTLDEQIDWASRLPVPVTYTGIVSERPVATARTAEVVVSAGGGDGGDFLPVVLEAWRLLDDAERSLVIYPPLGRTGPALAGARNARIESHAPRFLGTLAGADLSISHAGYNTCANLLETRAPAIVIPRDEMSDQQTRARLLEQRGLLRVAKRESLGAPTLARMMRCMMGVRMPEHGLDLNGAERTRELLTALASPPTST